MGHFFGWVNSRVDPSKKWPIRPTDPWPWRGAWVSVPWPMTHVAIFTYTKSSWFWIKLMIWRGYEHMDCENTGWADGINESTGPKSVWDESHTSHTVPAPMHTCILNYHILYRVFQKSSHPKTFWNIFTSVKSLCVNLANLLAFHIHICLPKFVHLS